MKECRARYFTLWLFGQICVLSCWIHGAFIFIWTSLCHKLSWNGLLATLIHLCYFPLNVWMLLYFRFSRLSFFCAVLFFFLPYYFSSMSTPFWMLCWCVSVRTDIPSGWKPARGLTVCSSEWLYLLCMVFLLIYPFYLAFLRLAWSPYQATTKYIWVWIESCEAMRWKGPGSGWYSENNRKLVQSADLICLSQQSQKQWLWESVHFNLHRVMISMFYSERLSEDTIESVIDKGSWARNQSFLI